MPFELQIKELNDYQKAQEFINSVDNYITLNMLKKYGIRPKIGKLALRKNPNTILAKPLHSNPLSVVCKLCVPDVILQSANPQEPFPHA